ncbi:MAG: hypothetical protein AB9915_00380 [Candidatus Dojkabacteria bacterium]
MPKKQGKIIANGVVLEKHENATVVFLTSKGFNIELIPPVLERKTPDIKMEKLFWEIKRPTGNSKYTIPHAFKSALKQSPNIIFDLRSSKLHQEKALSRLKKEFELSKGAKRLKVILKSKGIIDFSK